MKKIFVSISLAIMALLPTVGLAAVQKDSKCGTIVDNRVANLFSTGKDYCDLGSVLTRIVSMALAFISMIAVVMIIIGGYKYVTSGGSEEAAKSGRQTITYAVIGLIVAVLAYSIVGIINNTVKNETSSGATTGTDTNDTVQRKNDAQARINRGVTFTVSKVGDNQYYRIDAAGDTQDLYQVCPNGDRTGTVYSTITVNGGNKGTRTFNSMPGTIDLSSNTYHEVMTVDDSSNPVSAALLDQPVTAAIHIRLGSCTVTGTSDSRTSADFGI